MYYNVHFSVFVFVYVHNVTVYDHNVTYLNLNTVSVTLFYLWTVPNIDPHRVKKWLDFFNLGYQTCCEIS